MLYVIVSRKVRVKHKKYAPAYVKTVYDVSSTANSVKRVNVREFRFFSFP